MQTILAHFDGKFIVPDEPLTLPAGQALRIAIESVPQPSLPDLPPELEEQELGMVVIRGTRIPLYLVLEAVFAGKSWEQILDDFPTIPAKSIRPIDEFIARNQAATRQYFETEKAALERLYAAGKKVSSLPSLRGKIHPTMLGPG